MPYSQFTTITKVKEAFNLTTVEGVRFFPEIASIQPSNTLATTLEETLPLAVATGSAKARSELIISPVLVETRRILNRQISMFSGEDFNVNESLGLNGRCDFLISRSTEQLAIEAPAIVIVEAKQADLKTGIGQCVAGMVRHKNLMTPNKNHCPSSMVLLLMASNGNFLSLLEPK